MRLSIPIVAGASYYVVYALVNYTNHILNDYVVKMSYSKDKVHLSLYEGIIICQENRYAWSYGRRSV